MHTLQHSFVNQLLAHTAAGGDFVGFGQVSGGELCHRDATKRQRRRTIAPSALPDASARAAAVISESIQIPTDLSLPAVRWPAVNLSHDQHPASRRNSAVVASGSERRAMMTPHITATHDQWLEARRDLLAAEKDLTRRSDEVARLRQQLPWVRVEKTYKFDTETGSKTLKELFGGRSQLLVYHFLFGPGCKAGCPSCSMIADGFNGFAVHLANHDVTLMAVSRAPLAKLRAYKERMGWTFPWASSHGGDFNFDFNVSFTEAQEKEGRVEYNYACGGHAMDITPPRAVRRDLRHRCCHIPARPAGHERLRAGRRRGLSHLFDLCARPGDSLGRLSVARPRAQRRDRNFGGSAASYATASGATTPSSVQALSFRAILSRIVLPLHQRRSEASMSSFPAIKSGGSLTSICSPSGMVSREPFSHGKMLRTYWKFTQIFGKTSSPSSRESPINFMAVLLLVKPSPCHFGSAASNIKPLPEPKSIAF